MKKPRKHRYFVWSTNEEENRADVFGTSYFEFRDAGVVFDIIKDKEIILKGMITREEILKWIRSKPIHVKSEEQARKYLRFVK